MRADGVSGKCERLGRKCLPAPAAVNARVATALRWISLVELARHQAKHLRRQSGFERTSRAVHEEDVVAFLDARCRENALSDHAQRDDCNGCEPRHKSDRDSSRGDEDNGDNEQRIAKQVIDRQPKRGDREDERGNLEPRLQLRFTLARTGCRLSLIHI